MRSVSLRSYLPFPVVRWIEKQYIKQYTVHWCYINPCLCCASLEACLKVMHFEATYHWLSSLEDSQLKIQVGFIHISKMAGSIAQFVCISPCVQIKKSWPHSWPQYISTDWSPAPRTTLFPGPDIRRSPKYPRHTHLDNNVSAHWNKAGVKTLFFVSVITAVGRNPLCWKEEYYTIQNAAMSGKHTTTSRKHTVLRQNGLTITSPPFSQLFLRLFAL